MSAEPPNPLRAVYWQRSLIPVSETPNRTAPLSIPVGDDDEGLRRNSGLKSFLMHPPSIMGGRRDYEIFGRGDRFQQKWPIFMRKQIISTAISRSQGKVTSKEKQMFSLTDFLTQINFNSNGQF
ncbi:hypothetical protein CEXT_760681 [Caerostris extrusa]|uniref:Uncharacterized protein n=1 Tax=Caerostris extrusa TaxID=172846 RepID=A0AAV4S6W3_CAEEX|nr:hypothetical protein CEXT_760681 [Caerostris extrusa]